jgi:hypothetical protein
LKSAAIQLPRPPHPIKPNSIFELDRVPKAIDGSSATTAPAAAPDMKVRRFILLIMVRYSKKKIRYNVMIEYHAAMH